MVSVPSSSSTHVRLSPQVPSARIAGAVISGGSGSAVPSSAAAVNADTASSPAARSAIHPFLIVISIFSSIKIFCYSKVSSIIVHLFEIINTNSEIQRLTYFLLKMSPRFVSRSALTKHGDKYVNKFQRLRLMKFNSLPKLRFVRLTIFLKFRFLCTS